MAEKLEKSIPWFAILTICTLVVFGVGIVLNEIIADTIQPSVTVGNVALTVGTVILNGGNAITVTENTTVTVVGTTTITDSNTYSDITSVTSTLYLTNTTTCGTSDTNWCYATNWVTCATNTCSGNSCVASCTADVWFIAEPSDASSTYPTKDWQMDITALDSGSNADTGTTSQELNTLYALDVDSSITYGTLNPDATSANQTTNATNTGNYEIDPYLSGVNMETGGGTSSIAVGQQKFSAFGVVEYPSKTQLSSTPYCLNVTLPKPTATTSNSSDEFYWQIRIPTSILSGVYTGTNTVEAGTKSDQ